MTDGVPTPEEFVKLMDKGGPRRRRSWRRWSGKSRRAVVLKSTRRQVELLKLAANSRILPDSLIRIGMRPVLPSGEDLAWLAKTNMWWAYSAIFGVQDLLPYPDLSDLAEDGFSVEEAHEARRRSEQRQEENASRVRALRGRAHILATAKNEKDFELRLDTMIHDEDGSSARFSRRWPLRTCPGKATRSTRSSGRARWCFAPLSGPSPTRRSTSLALAGRS